jgi:hypothetical protein
MASSGNTWFKIKREKGKRLGLLSHKVATLATVKTKRHARWAEDRAPADKIVKPREADKRVRSGFVFQPFGGAKAARRAAYHERLGAEYNRQ